MTSPWATFLKVGVGLGGNVTNLISAVAFAAMFACTESASGQTYPSHPISMIVPYPAGGPTDVIGRIVAERMRVSLGQPIVIDNIGGASGVLVLAGSPARFPMATRLG